MSVIIRSADMSDLSAVQDLNHQLFQHDFEFDPTLDIEWPYKSGKEYFASAISSNDKCCFVAIDGDEVVGYLAGSIKDKIDYSTVTFAELDNTLVDEKCRGQGVGKKLFYEFRKWAKDNGADKIVVSAYYGNANAVNFYHKIGFNDYAREMWMEVEDD